MVDKLSSEQRDVGKQNYYSAIGSYYDVNRRDFLRGIVAAGAVSNGARTPAGPQECAFRRVRSRCGR